MGCQCTTISNCQHDIGKLEDIRSLLSQAVSASNVVDQYRTSLKNGIDGAVRSINDQEFIASVLKINEEIAKSITRLLEKCSTQTSSLVADLSMLQSEDTAHHRANN